MRHSKRTVSTTRTKASTRRHKRSTRGKTYVEYKAAGTTTQSECYAQALGVVVVRSLSVELLGRMETRSGRPSYRATQGQNHGVRRGQEKSGNQPEDQGIHKGDRSQGASDAIAWYWYRRSSLRLSHRTSYG